MRIMIVKMTIVMSMMVKRFQNRTAITKRDFLESLRKIINEHIDNNSLNYFNTKTLYLVLIVFIFSAG